MRRSFNVLTGFLRGAPPRANPGSVMDDALDEFRRAIEAFPVDSTGRRRYLDREGRDTWLLPFSQGKKWWLARAREIGEEATVAELLAHVAEVRSFVEPTRARIARERAARDDERAWESQAYLVTCNRGIRLGDAFRGRLVWLFHGTSTAKLRSIQRKGIRPDAPKRAHSDASRGRVFLTSYDGGALYSGGMPGATMYAERAAYVFGGNPVVLRVIVPWNWLEPDSDDADLSCSHLQWECPKAILPAQLMEANGERLRGLLRDDEPWRAGYVGPRDVSARVRRT